MIVTIDRLSHSYAPSRKQKEPRLALKEIGFDIQRGEMFCLLGPNGSGKSTLFKILSTLVKPTSGKVTMFNLDIQRERNAIRERIGIIFQHPSLDAKLTARENLVHQGHLYHLRGEFLKQRIEEMLTKVGMLDRANDLVEHLSGGMQRRVELAKALLHAPELLILDEPSTGLDPGARRDFGVYLKELQSRDGVTILLTTHILDEADRCDRIAILDEGTVVALGSPQKLKGNIGGDVLTLTSDDPLTLAESIRKQFGIIPQVIGQTIHIERSEGHEFIPQLVQAFPGLIQSVTLSKPSLEDVFIKKTGHTFWKED